MRERDEKISQLTVLGYDSGVLFTSIFYFWFVSSIFRATKWVLDFNSLYLIWIYEEEGVCEADCKEAI